MEGLFREENTGVIRPLQAGDRIMVQVFDFGITITFSSSKPGECRLIPISRNDDRILISVPRFNFKESGVVRLIEVITGLTLKYCREQGKFLYYELTSDRKPREAREGLLA